MANQITNSKARGDKDKGLRLSNGATDVLISVLLLAGSEFAKNNWEKSLLFWLAEKDIGGGIVGFDIDEIGWTTKGFDKEKEFTLDIINKASTKYKWELLGYDPPYVLNYLEELAKLIVEFKIEYIVKPEEFSFVGDNVEFRKCEKHGVFLHTLDADPAKCCQICNNAPIN